ncbi:hypothetical protein VPH35_137192 [Triticum aestivum]
MKNCSPRLAPAPTVRLASSEGMRRCVSGESHGIRLVFVFGGSTWIPSLFVCICVCMQVGSFRSTLLFISGSCCSGALVYMALARRLPECLLQQGLPGSSEGGVMTAARLRLASMIVVVIRWSTDLDVFFTSSTLCTTLNRSEIFSKKDLEVGDVHTVWLFAPFWGFLEPGRLSL